MPDSPVPLSRFATTRWTLIVQAGQRAPEAREALADLCRLYWYPIYAYVRRRGHDASQAEDLTQAFFTRLLEKETLAAVDPQRGRFRSFLLTACQHFLANERQRDLARKRGGGQVVSLDLATAEGLYSRESQREQSPERLFERRWALTLLARVLDRLREEYTDTGKERLFAVLHRQLTGEDGPTYAAQAQELGMAEGSIKAAVHRLRKRYGELLREEIGETVATPAAIEDEVRALFTALGD